jgi:NAD(P)-dependent dehydrogenase (short-subunit alcohol dehydrogenase family)
MEHYFRGKTVLVTGAGWGIGAATALLYAASGAKVIVSDTSRKGGKDTLAKIKNQKGNATYIKADVSDEAACEELIKRTIRTYGSIDIACNNSAVFCETLYPADSDMESSDNLAGLNLSSLNNCMQYEIEAMQRQRGGVIINTLSIMSAIGMASSSRYIEAKYGRVTPLQNIPGAPSPIHIHTISPPYITAALLKERLRQKTEGKVRLFPPDMRGTIQEVARLILWLSSDESRLLSTVFNDTN